MPSEFDLHPSYDFLPSMVRLIHAPLSLQAKLDQITKAVSETFQSDRCLLIHPPDIRPGGLFFRLASEKKPLWIEKREASFQEEEPLPEEKDFLSPAFACIPLCDYEGCQGILYVGFASPHPFSPQETEHLLFLGEIAGTIIRNDTLYQQIAEIISDVSSIATMGNAAAATLKLEDLFDLIIATGLKILNARGGVLRVEDKKTGELKVQASRGDYHTNLSDEGIAKRVFYSQTPLFLNHSVDKRPSFSLLCVPFVSRGKTFGTLTFYDKAVPSGKFNEKDSQLLSMMTNQISHAVENAMIHHETSEMARQYEKRAKELSTLWELNKALLTTVNFERILHLTLTAITMGEGLRFNRAMLFLVNEKERFLEGTLAVGPDNAEEAGKIWMALSRGKGMLSETITQLSFNQNSFLNAMVKGIRIPLDQASCILPRTVLEGMPFHFQFPQSREGWLQTQCETGCRLGTEVGCFMGKTAGDDSAIHSFATVPLTGKGRILGVILVDNHFNQNPITEEDVQFLNMFSSQAGLAIENALLYRHLEEIHQDLKEAQNQLVYQEKMAALGEMSDSIAHELKNPLTSIGGFARRLDRSLPEETPGKKYARTILKEADRFEKILGKFFNYTQDQPPAYKELDIKTIVEESHLMAAEGIPVGKIRLIKEYAETIPRVKGDLYQLNQVFFSLINNAYQAMKEKGTLVLRIQPVSKNGSHYVKVEVKDTGPGIDPENLHNIFNPFYSTREEGLGLGLPIVHKFITSHHGQIEVDNSPGKGVSFIVTLPAVETERKTGA